MRRTKTWIGVPIVDEQSGRERGKVCEVLFEQDAHIYGLLLTPGGWLRKPTFLSYKDVAAFGTNAVMAHSKVHLRKAQELTEFRPLAEGKEAFCGKLLYMPDGNLYGEVADVYIEEESDKIVGYEVSDGLLADLVYGRRFIAREEVQEIGDFMLVSHQPQPIPKSVH
ncbi:MAG: hypothetical protein JWN30_2356 [Bacilli bacterium]|nr:hypothetical protein [Bacilli bacterium]